MIGVAVVMAAAWQFNLAGALRAQIRSEQSAARSNLDVLAEHTRLLAAQAASTVQGEAGKLIDEARAEVAGLRRQLETAVRTVAEKETQARFADGSVMPASEWKDSGRATPKSALETVLWSGAAGDVDTLARSLLLINGSTRTAAQRLVDNLPEPVREHYGTPERLIAFLAVKDVPVGAVEVRRSQPLEGWPAPTQLFNVLLTAEDGKHKDVQLVFMQTGGEWKLVVMEGVVTKYAAMLKEP